VLSGDQFQLEQFVFEVRYPFAFLHWDRSGTIWSELARKWPELESVVAQPGETRFRLGNSYQFTIAMERASAEAMRPKIEEFAAFSDHFMAVLIRELQIAELRRVALRSIFFRVTKDLQTASIDFIKTGLVRVPEGKVFGIEAFSTTSPKYSMRWEGKSTAATLTVEAQRRSLNFQPPFGFHGIDAIKKEETGILFDVDYSTTAPMAVGTLKPSEWIPQVFRVVKRDLETGLEILK
jgi:hypothetical protein